MSTSQKKMIPFGIKQASSETNTRLEALIQAIPDVIFFKDVQGRNLVINRAFEELFGISQKDIVGKTDGEFLPPDLAEYCKKSDEEVLMNRKAMRFEEQSTGKDGEKIFFETTKAPLLDNVGNIIGLVGVCRNITERKQAEEALRNAAQQWRTTFDGISDIVCLLDSEGRILRCNKAMVNFFGKPFSEIIGRPYWEIVYGKTASIQECPVMRMKETCHRQTAILPIKDRWFDIAVDPLLDETGRLIGAVHIMSDITERKQSEEALQKSEEKYRDILETIEEGYFEIDLAGNFTFVNDREASFLGYSREELIRMNNRQYTDLETSKKLHQVFSRVYTTGEPAKKIDIEVLKKDGTKGFVEIWVYLKKDSAGQPTGFRGIARDITERMQAEEERAVLQEQLRQSQKMEAIGQLAGGVAHDFNNLLTVIKGYSQLSLNEIKENDPLRESIEEVRNAADRAADLTRKLLAFSRRQVLEMKVLDLNTVLRDLDKMLHRLIGEDIELTTLLVDDLGRVKTDPGWVEQIIMNLAVNARDAMPNGGKLTIETANAELDGAYAHNHIDVTTGRYVMLSMSDTGVGMTPEVRQHVFEPFFTTKEKGKGTGLGLSTVYGIVKQSGGNIWVYSEPGLGTTFKIYLPRVDESIEEVREKVTGEELSRGGETILLAEDEESVRRLSVQVLKRQGYEVLEASCGNDALVVSKEHKGPIHMILTDVVMPGMSGRQLANQLKSLHPKMKVLYMSGYTDNAIVHHCVLDEGVNYIQKPFTVDGLTKRVREVLDKDSKPSG